MTEDPIRSLILDLGRAMNGAANTPSFPFDPDKMCEKFIAAVRKAAPPSMAEEK